MTEAAHTQLKFTDLDGGGAIATLLLDRPNQANAFSAQMMDEITRHLLSLKDRHNLRLLVIAGAGKHFSAGADLEWMRSSAKLSFDDNIKDATRLRSMFEALTSLQVPKIAAIKGAVYGGAIGLAACCDFAVALDSAKFCLSEAKLGLLPAVIAPYLARKMRPGQLRRAALTARLFDAHEAKDMGLIEVVAADLDAAVLAEINAILACGPAAQKSMNRLFDQLREQGYAQCDETVQAIAKARTGPEGQAGLTAFFDKSTPPWIKTLSSYLPS
jgi:methylglutaconyl-CoA hydratase